MTKGFLLVIAALAIVEFAAFRTFGPQPERLCWSRHLIHDLHPAILRAL